jgi:uncharacterized integral membrane protein
MDWKDEDRRTQAPRGDKTRISPTLVVFLLVVVIAVIFILQNTDKAQIDFLFWSGTVDIWIAIVIALVLGALIDRLGSYFLRRRRRREAQP